MKLPEDYTLQDANEALMMHEEALEATEEQIEMATLALERNTKSAVLLRREIEFDKLVMKVIADRESEVVSE